MKLSKTMFPLIVVFHGCGGSPAPASPPAAMPTSASSAQPAHPMAHEMPMAEPSANPAAPAAIPAAVEASPAAASAAPTAPAAAASGAKATLSVSISSTPATAAKHAVAYLEDAPKDREVTGSMDNRQMAFVPHVVVVTAGAKITFSNSDPFPHNVFSADNEKWDMGMIPAHGARVRRFEKPGYYTVLCNVHPNMKAFIVVVPSSYFAKADKNGELSIKDVPTGKYKLVVWAPGTKSEEQEVTLDGDKSLKFDLHRK